VTTNAALPIDDELDEQLDVLTAMNPGLAQIASGIRHLLTEPLTTDQTQTTIAFLAGSAGADVLSLIGSTVEHLTNADTNPSLRDLPCDQQKTIRLIGEKFAYTLNDPDLHQPASDASGAIDNH
jgi:hypothetical protein